MNKDGESFYSAFKEERIVGGQTGVVVVVVKLGFGVRGRRSLVSEWMEAR